jgi:two-component system, response regulator
MSNRSILLVEDNADDEELTVRALRAKRITSEIITARDGFEALDYLFGSGTCGEQRSRALPAVVLLDLQLPGMDGFEVLRRVRAAERTRVLPVVVLTSSREEQDLLESYGLGCNSYIRKPVDFDKFLEVAEQVSLYWLVLNELPSWLGAPA